MGNFCPVLRISLTMRLHESVLSKTHSTGLHRLHQIHPGYSEGAINGHMTTPLHKTPSVYMSQTVSYLSAALLLSCVRPPLIETVRFIGGLCVVRCCTSLKQVLSAVELSG